MGIPLILTTTANTFEGQPDGEGKTTPELSVFGFCGLEEEDTTQLDPVLLSIPVNRKPHVPPPPVGEDDQSAALTLAAAGNVNPFTPTASTIFPAGSLIIRPAEVLELHVVVVAPL